MDVTYGPVNFSWEGGVGGFGGDHLIIRGGASPFSRRQQGIKRWPTTGPLEGSGKFYFDTTKIQRPSPSP